LRHVLKTLKFEIALNTRYPSPNINSQLLLLPYFFQPLHKYPCGASGLLESCLRNYLFVEELNNMWVHGEHFTVERQLVSRRAIDQYHTSWSRKVLVPLRSPPPLQVCLLPLCCMIEQTQDILRYQSTTTKSDEENGKLEYSQFQVIDEQPTTPNSESKHVNWFFKSSHRSLLR
jgi:hypothetical protein